MFERRRSLAATALLLAFAGCDSPSGAPRATAPARMEVVSGDLQQFTVGELLPERLVVRIADSDGRPVSNQLVNFRVAAGDGSVLAGAGVTDAEGLAQDSWTLGPAAGDSQRVEVRAVDRSTGNVLVSAAFTAIGRPAEPAAIAPTVRSDRTGPAGLPLADSVAVKVTDRYGNGVRGAVIMWQVEFGGGAVAPATSTTDEDGVARALWTLGTRLDSVQVMAAAAGVSLATRIHALATVPPSVVLTRFSGNGQRGTVATELTDPLVVLVTLPDGRPLPGAEVKWVLAGGGSINSATADHTGRAAARWALGTVAGKNTAMATVAEAAPILFEATAQAAPADALSKAGGDEQSAIVGTTLREVLLARVVDRFGNPTPGVPVQWTVSDEGGSVHPSTSSTDSAGYARTSWTLGSSAGLRTVSATTGAASSVTFAATAEPRGSRLVFLDQPTRGEAGESLGAPFRVAIQNEFGTTDVTATAAVTLTLPPDSTGAILSGVVAVNAVAGVATFDAVRIDRPGTFKLVAAVYGFAAGASETLRIGIRAAGIALGSTHTCILAASGAPYCWGSNSSGQLGDGTTVSRPTPTPAGAGLRFTELITTNGYAAYTCGVHLAGDIYCWGNGKLAPALVTGGLRFVQVSAGDEAACGVSADNDAYCWGVGTSPSVPARVTGDLKFSQISAGMNFTCGLTTDNRAYCWGYNAWGQLGDGTVAYRSSPVAVKTSLSFRQIKAGERHACGITTDDAAYCWGLNNYGQLGDGSMAQRLTPAAVAGGLRFAHLSVAQLYTCGVTADHVAHCWGNNTAGRLGNGTTEHRLEPTPVNGGLSFARVHAGGNSTCGTTTSYGAYCWGANRLAPVPMAH